MPSSIASSPQLSPFQVPALRLGQSQSNKSVNACARKLFAAFRSCQCLPPEPSENELAGDNLQNYITLCGHFLSSRLIPQRSKYNAQFEPDEDCVSYLKTPTLRNYIGQHFKDIREALPNHVQLKNLGPGEFPLWYSAFLVQFERACSRYHIDHGHEMNEGSSNNIRPLFFKNTNPDKTDFISRVSLEQILTKIMKEAPKNNVKDFGHFEQRAMLMLSFSAIGRAGEIKFQKFSDWRFDPYLQTTDIKWEEKKTLTMHAMPMVPDKSYLVCFYHAIACYFALEDGLYRNETQQADGHYDFLFPSLQKIGNNSVAKKVGSIIKTNLPP
ncbi:unnamed protein product, partial [Cylindrotheca closterium]